MKQAADRVTRTASPAASLAPSELLPPAANPARALRRRWRLRFSLQTLLIFFLLAGTASALYVRWRPWSWVRDLPIAEAGKLVYSRDSRLLMSTRALLSENFDEAAGLERMKAQLWEIRDGARLAEYKGHEAEVTSAVISPDGGRVATTGCDGSVRLWPLHGKTSHILSKHTPREESAAFSPDGSLLATAGWAGFRVFDLAADKEIAYFPAIGRGVVGFSADGRRVTAADEWGPTYSWTVGSKSPPVKILQTSDDVARYTDGEFVFGVRASSAYLARADDGKQLATFSGSYAPQMAISPDRCVAVLIERVLRGKIRSDSLKVFSIANGDLLYTIPGADACWSLAIAPDGTLAAGGSKSVHIYRLNHPAFWWGFMCLPEFWLLFPLAALLLRSMRPAKQKANEPAAQHQPA